MEVTQTSIFRATDFSSQCDNSLTAASYYFSALPGTIVISFDSIVSNPVLFFGVKRIADVTLTFNDEVCVIGGATQENSLVVRADGSSDTVVAPGRIRRYASGAVTILGEMDTFGFSINGILPFFTVGWSE